MIGFFSILVFFVVLVATYRLFFKDPEEFAEAARLFFQPDIVSMFNGEWGDDMKASMRFSLWIGIAIAGAFGFYFGMDALLG